LIDEDYFFPHKYGIISVPGRVLAADPCVPTETGAGAASFRELAFRNVLRFQDQLNVNMKLRSHIQAHQVYQDEECFSLWNRGPIRQEFNELGVGERPDSHPDLALKVKNALTDHSRFPELVVPGLIPEAGLVAPFQVEPFPLELPHLHGQLKEVLQECLQSGRASRAMGQ
jgi:hypothetical protein